MSQGPMSQGPKSQGTPPSAPAAPAGAGDPQVAPPAAQGPGEGLPTVAFASRRPGAAPPPPPAAGIANLRVARLPGAGGGAPGGPRGPLAAEAARKQAERRAQRAQLVEDEDEEDAGPSLLAARRSAAARRAAAQGAVSASAEPVSAPMAPPPEAEEIAPPPSFRPPARLARTRMRHWGLLASFLLLVLLPVLGTAWYLWAVAEDQYASTVGFSVRREEASNPIDVLGGLAGISSSSSSDTDILYEFLKSQKLVADMDAQLNLRAIWSKPEGDPVFTFDPDGSIEDLVDYWGRMVRTSYDGSTGLIEIRVLAFTPGEATTIAQAIFDESAKMINALSDIAREDAIRFARADLQEAEEKLRTARAELTRFRVENRLVDPASAIQTQAGILGTLEGQLTEALIEVELLAESTQPSDPRLRQAQRRVEVIRERIMTERNKVGIGDGGDVGEAYADLVADYERLTVDREFTETAYVAALAAYDSALAEARRTSRYLAAHILPTTAEVSRYPEREILLGMVAMFLSIAWAIGALVVYSLRDRR